MATILITGGTGLVGKSLGQALLKKGYQVIILSRNADKSSTIAGLSYAQWNVEAQTIDRQAIEKADYVIHLSIAYLLHLLLPGEQYNLQRLTHPDQFAVLPHPIVHNAGLGLYFCR